MKRVKFLLGVFLLSCICLQAQSKWIVAPLAGVAMNGDGSGTLNWGYNANLTLGRYVAYLGKHGRLRTDVCAGYFGFSENSAYSAAAMLTGCDDGTTEWYHSFSLGFGIQKSANRSKPDFIIPIRMTLPFTAYRFNDRMCLGLDWAVNFNLSDFGAGNFIYWGLFFEIGL
ncbi:MAG: hypothetical protein LBV41_02095 [Cytophagaceae bacterium]|jgi:hypothetical protein|nr:hypothetical protein [Cytophagaceae bacterium]